MASTFGEYNIAGTNALLVLSLRCPVCRRDIAPPFVVIGDPYHAALHRQCLPHFAFDGVYPHDLPVAHMLRGHSTDAQVLPFRQPHDN